MARAKHTVRAEARRRYRQAVEPARRRRRRGARCGRAEGRGARPRGPRRRRARTRRPPAAPASSRRSAARTTRPSVREDIPHFATLLPQPGVPRGTGADDRRGDRRVRLLGLQRRPLRLRAPAAAGLRAGAAARRRVLRAARQLFPRAGDRPDPGRARRDLRHPAVGEARDTAHGRPVDRPPDAFRPDGPVQRHAVRVRGGVVPTLPLTVEPEAGGGGQGLVRSSAGEGTREARRSLSRAHPSRRMPACATFRQDGSEQGPGETRQPQATTNRLRPDSLAL